MWPWLSWLPAGMVGNRVSLGGAETYGGPDDAHVGKRSITECLSSEGKLLQADLLAFLTPNGESFGQPQHLQIGVIDLGHTAPDSHWTCLVLQDVAHVHRHQGIVEPIWVACRTMVVGSGEHDGLGKPPQPPTPRATYRTWRRRRGRGEETNLSC